MTATTGVPIPPASEAKTGQPSGGRRRKTLSEKRPASTTYILILLLTVFFLGPFLWLVLSTLKSPAEWSSLPITILPKKAQWDNFGQAFTSMDFMAYVVNSLFLSTTYAVLITLSSAAVGFGFARLRAPGKRWLFILVLSTMMLP